MPSTFLNSSVYSRRSVFSLVMAGLLVGCTRSVTADPDGSKEAIEPLPADRIVFGVSRGPGFAPAIYYQLQSPSLVIYGSGRILRADETTGAVPSRYLEAQVDPLAVARFVRKVETSNVLQADFGTPTVTDLGVDRVWVHGSRQQGAEPYALNATFDDSVSADQRRHRQQLRALIEDGKNLAGSSGAPYVPERIVVLASPHRDRGQATPTPPTWPGPDLASFLHKPDRPDDARGADNCGELTGNDARTVYQAAVANPEQRWLVGGKVRVLAVNSLPVEITC